MTLPQLLIDAAQAAPSAVAAIAPDATATYGELDELAAGAAHVLTGLGIGSGHRVGLYVQKSIRALAFMQGALRVGAAYVPIDPASPPARAADAFARCDVSAVVTNGHAGKCLRALLAPHVRHITFDDGGAASWADVVAHARGGSDVVPAPDDALAFILCTSGSTGASKGVCISHRNALAFVSWAVTHLDATAADRFANHAAHNFDLSVLDIYGAWLSRGSVVLVPEDVSSRGPALAEFCRRHGVSVWYSVPSALALMLQGPSFTGSALPSLRHIIFAGEVFPIKGVRALRVAFPQARLHNFYGPTETNVCTAYEVHDVPQDSLTPLPIGGACCGNRAWAVTDDGSHAVTGEQGELVVEGPTVALGYWGGTSFVAGEPYHTGDWVRVLANGDFEFVGRRDRLVKVRGQRVDLGEVENALLSHPDLSGAAVIVNGEGADARLVAFLVTMPGAAAPSLIAIKQHCAALVPAHMIVARAQFVDALPRTANGKVDYQALGRTDDNQPH